MGFSLWFLLFGIGALPKRLLDTRLTSGALVLTPPISAPSTFCVRPRTNYRAYPAALQALRGRFSSAHE